jgi:RNase P subunit RPR2
VKVLAVPVPVAIITIQHTCKSCRALLEIQADDCRPSRWHQLDPLELVATCGHCKSQIVLPIDTFEAKP